MTSDERRRKVLIALDIYPRTFYPFINDKSVRLVGVEAAGEGSSYLFLFSSNPIHSDHLRPFNLPRPRCLLSLRDLKLTLPPSTGIDTPKHSATLTMGKPGVLHGVRTYLLQSPTGQIIESHSICAGLDYPGVGPEHAWLKDIGRAEYVSATDEQCLRGFRACTEMEGIIPALETSHAIWGAMQLAKTMDKEQNIVLVSLIHLLTKSRDVL